MNPKPTFEEALQRLEAIAEQIERGQIGLEESIARYEEGVQLIRHCRDVLARAELRVQQLQIDDQGKVESRPFPVAAPPTAGDASAK